MKQSLFFSELKKIFSNKKILIPIIAIIFVPILYAGMFLWSFWDPYGHLQDLPVAVVNEDTGANYEGEALELGDELVNKLKDNEEFQFHFVSKEDGYQDLEDQKYYMLVEIPKDFSQHATTLLDEKPKKLQMKYVPNESYNFLSSQIGETAVKEIKTAISSEISATYAETMFDKVTEMTDGLGNASDGAGELHDGAQALEDGSEELKDNLIVLADKSIEFQNGVNQAEAGMDDVADGSENLANGISQLSDGGGKLLNAARGVQDGSQSLVVGTTKANKGLQEMDQKVPELVAGTDQVKDGLKEFQMKLPIEMAETIGGQMQTSAGQMNAGLDELQSQLGNQLSVALAEQISQQQTAQTEQVFATLKENDVDPKVLGALQQQIKKSSPTKEELQKQLQQRIGSGLDQGFTRYKNEVNEHFANATDGLEGQIKDAVNPTFNKLYDGIVTINQKQETLQSGVHELADGSKRLKDGSLALSEGQKQYVDSLALFNSKLSNATNGANTLASGAGQLDSGMNELADATAQISDGANKLADGSKELANGTVELEDGTDKLYNKLGGAASEASSVHADDDTYDMMGNPVNVEKQEINKVPNYGTGFAPYFLSLGLFVGALLITIVYQLKEPVIKPKNGFTWFMGKFGVVALVGVVQALIADVILLFGLGIDVKSIPFFVLTSIVTSLAFMTLIQFLVTSMGDPGRFLAIIILIFQLTTSAGTFPLELIPDALQPINAALPMTYTVQAFKAVISSGNFTFMWQNIGILLAYIIGFMMLTMVYFIVKHRNHRTVNEEVSLQE
ncbi:YhgE/Pip family protein [Virgibacillus sp. FSP13]